MTSCTMNRPTAALATLSAGKARLASAQRPLNALRSRCYHGRSKLSNRVVRVHAAAATDESIQPSPPPLLTDARKEYNRQFQRPVGGLCIGVCAASQPCLHMHASVLEACFGCTCLSYLWLAPATAQVFDFERWKTHRSSSRYLRHVLGMRDSKIVSDFGS
jgi:hypothetical protein